MNTAILFELFVGSDDLINVKRLRLSTLDLEMLDEFAANVRKRWIFGECIHKEFLIFLRKHVFFR